MHCVRKLNKDLYWVGAEDRRLNLFENLFPISRGIAYNSYLIKDDKNVLLDTVDYSCRKTIFRKSKICFRWRKYRLFNN